MRLVAAGDPAGLLLIDALRQLHALVGKRTVGVHGAHRAGELAHLEEELNGERLQLLAAQLAVGDVEPERVTAEGAPRRDTRGQVSNEVLRGQNLAHLRPFVWRARRTISSALP